MNYLWYILLEYICSLNSIIMLYIWHKNGNIIISVETFGYSKDNNGGTYKIIGIHHSLRRPREPLRHGVPMWKYFDWACALKHFRSANGISITSGSEQEVGCARACGARELGIDIQQYPLITDPFICWDRGKNVLEHKAFRTRTGLPELRSQNITDEM